MRITAYYDRKSSTDNNGFFTVKQTSGGNVLKEFTRLPARSGQWGFQDSWTRAKSPIPFSDEITGEYKIWLNGQSQWLQWAFGGGIGEFWRISNHNDRTSIIGKESGQYRSAIGVHPENEYPGSAGCIVLVNDTREQEGEIIRLRNWLLECRKKYKIDHIKLVVL